MTNLSRDQKIDLLNRLKNDPSVIFEIIGPTIDLSKASPEDLRRLYENVYLYSRKGLEWPEEEKEFAKQFKIKR